MKSPSSMMHSPLSMMSSPLSGMNMGKGFLPFIFSGNPNQQKKKTDASKSKAKQMEKLLKALGIDDDDDNDDYDDRYYRQPPPRYQPQYDDYDDYDDYEPRRAKKGDDEEGGGKKKKEKDKTQDAVNKALEEEKKKQEEEKKKEEALKRKKKMKEKLRAMLWTTAWPHLFKKATGEKIDARRAAFNAQVSDDIRLAMDSAKGWCKTAITKAMAAVIPDIKTAKHISPVNGKKVADKDANDRATWIFTKLKGIMDAMINQTTEEIMPKALLNFLNKVYYDHAYLPQTFITDFELQRLNFNTYGGLKDTNKEKLRMNFAMLMIIRILVKELLSAPWEFDAKVPKNDIVKNNMRTLASCLVLTTLDFIKGVIPIQRNNTTHLPNELKTKPAPPFKFIQDEEVEPVKKKDDVDTVMIGLFRREDLNAFYIKKPNEQGLKALVDGWSTKMWSIVNRIHEEEEKKKAAATQKK